MRRRGSEKPVVGFYSRGVAADRRDPQTPHPQPYAEVYGDYRLYE